MLLGMVSRVSRGMGVLNGGIVEGEGAVLGVNLGHPIVTNVTIDRCLLFCTFERHNKGLLGEGKIKCFYLDIGRIIGNFHFSIIPIGRSNRNCWH